tara:strand:+ start:655 stop:1662 length:1008 start_codon:yes stop_codon:yes gene_type:complete
MPTTIERERDAMFIPVTKGGINCAGDTPKNFKAKETDNYDFITTADPTKMEPTRADNVNAYVKSQDKYLSKDHPLSGHMKITPQWTTPIGELELNVPEEMRIGLIKFVASRGYCTTMGTHKKTQTPEFEKNHYNMFEYTEDNEAGKHIRGFEKIASEMIRYYIANAWDITNADELQLEARGFGNMQTKGRRTYPHYHHGFDGVMITYLTTGGEFELKENGPTPEDAKLLMIPPNSEVEKIENQTVAQYESFDLKKDDLPCEGSGNMILQDPRPAINYPYCNKAIAFEPKVGTTIFHPAYLWHESNTFMGEGIRAAIVVNYRVLTRNNSGLVKPLA